MTDTKTTASVSATAGAVISAAASTATTIVEPRLLPAPHPLSSNFRINKFVDIRPAGPVRPPVKNPSEEEVNRKVMEILRRVTAQHGEEKLRAMMKEPTEEEVEREVTEILHRVCAQHSKDTLCGATNEQHTNKPAAEKTEHEVTGILHRVHAQHSEEKLRSMMNKPSEEEVEREVTEILHRVSAQHGLETRGTWPPNSRPILPAAVKRSAPLLPEPRLPRERHKASRIDTEGSRERKFNDPTVITSDSGSREHSRTLNVALAPAPMRPLRPHPTSVPSSSSLVPTTTTTGSSNSTMYRRCSCSKSCCLKLYCECFAAGVYCSDCSCVSCFNLAKHSEYRQLAITRIVNRKPDAFKSKIAQSSESSSVHVRGCNCKRSGCLKNYCECFEARIPCTDRCRCRYCCNTNTAYDPSNGKLPPPWAKTNQGIQSDQPPRSSSTTDPGSQSQSPTGSNSPVSACGHSSFPPTTVDLSTLLCESEMSFVDVPPLSPNLSPSNSSLVSNPKDASDCKLISVSSINPPMIVPAGTSGPTVHLSDPSPPSTTTIPMNPLSITNTIAVAEQLNQPVQQQNPTNAALSALGITPGDPLHSGSTSSVKPIIGLPGMAPNLLATWIALMSGTPGAVSTPMAATGALPTAETLTFLNTPHLTTPVTTPRFGMSKTTAIVIQSAPKTTPYVAAPVPTSPITIPTGDTETEYTAEELATFNRILSQRGQRPATSLDSDPVESLVNTHSLSTDIGVDREALRHLINETGVTNAYKTDPGSVAVSTRSVAIGPNQSLPLQTVKVENPEEPSPTNSFTGEVGDGCANDPPFRNDRFDQTHIAHQISRLTHQVRRLTRTVRKQGRLIRDLRSSQQIPITTTSTMAPNTEVDQSEPAPPSSP